jgi:hypothetical protein
MSFREIIAVFFKSHKKHDSTLCEQNAELRTELFWIITQLVVVTSYGRFGTTNMSLFRESNNYHLLLPNKLKERRSHHQKPEITKKAVFSNVKPGGTHPHPWTLNVRTAFLKLFLSGDHFY